MSFLVYPLDLMKTQKDKNDFLSARVINKYKARELAVLASEKRSKQD